MVVSKAIYNSKTAIELERPAGRRLHATPWGRLKQKNMNDYPRESYSDLSTEELVERLVNAGLDIPQGLPQEILARGAGAVDLLGRMMLDEALWKDARSPRGWGPIHAMHLLGGLKALEALAYFEKLLVPDRNTDHITETMPAILAAHGHGALESLKRIASNRDAEKYNRNAGVRALCLIAYRHPESKHEVVEFLRDLFGQTVQEGDDEFIQLISDDIAGLKDPRAMEDIRGAVKAGLPCESFFSWQSLEEIYKNPGSSYTIIHDDTDPMYFFSRKNLEYLRRINPASGDNTTPREVAGRKDGIPGAASVQTVKRTAPKPGRNEPCPCGSGMKYKKCCFEKE